MREIEFRGKDCFGNWHYGLLPYMNMIKEFTNHEWVDNEDNSLVKNYATTENIKIESETLGQYTGLQDANGNKIFEGDIIKIFNKYIRVVKYSEIKASFVTLDKDEFLGFLGDYNSNQIIIAGNIYDNQELIERQTI